MVSDCPLIGFDLRLVFLYCVPYKPRFLLFISLNVQRLLLSFLVIFSRYQYNGLYVIEVRGNCICDFYKCMYAT